MTDPRSLCPWCAKGAPHHTIGVRAISDAVRYTVWDLHEIEDTSGVGLVECLAAPLWALRAAYRAHTEGTAR